MHHSRLKTSLFIDVIDDDDDDGRCGVVWALRGHSRSSAMSPFDRAHTTSYSTLIETMRLSCTVFKI